MYILSIFSKSGLNVVFMFVTLIKHCFILWVILLSSSANIVISLGSSSDDTMLNASIANIPYNGLGAATNCFKCSKNCL